jgi:hypothetical protein
MTAALPRASHRGLRSAERGVRLLGVAEKAHSPSTAAATSAFTSLSTSL